MRMRQPTAIQTAFSAPGRPVVLIKGEKAKASSPGAVVLIHMELRPNTAPQDPAGQRAQQHRPQDHRDMQGRGLDDGQRDQADARGHQDQFHRHQHGQQRHPSGVFLTVFHIHYLLLSLFSRRMQRIFVRGPVSQSLNRIIITKLPPDCKTQIF